MNNEYEKVYGLLDTADESTDYVLKNEEFESMNNGFTAGAAAGAGAAALGA